MNRTQNFNRNFTFVNYQISNFRKKIFQVPLKDKILIVFSCLIQLLLQIRDLSHMTSYTLTYGYRRFWTVCFHTTSEQSIKTNSFRYAQTISFLGDSFGLLRIKFKELGPKQTVLWYVIYGVLKLELAYKLL